MFKQEMFHVILIFNVLAQEPANQLIITMSFIFSNLCDLSHSDNDMNVRRGS